MKHHIQLSPSLIALFVVCALAVVSLLYVPLPILPQLVQTYRLSPSMAGYALGSFGIAYALGFLVFGPLSDRIGRKKVMVAGLLGLAAASLAFLVIQSPATFLVGRALQGFVAASFPPVALAYLAERGTPKQRVWGVAWMSTAFLSAGLLGQIYGGVVADRWGFGLALLPMVAIYLITALRIWAAPDEEARVRPSAPIWTSYRPLGHLLGNAQLQRVYGTAFLLLMCFVAFYIHLDAHFGLALQQAGIDRLVAREIALPAFLMPLVVASLIPRWGAHRIASMGLVVTAGGLALAASTGETQLSLLMAASVVFVAGIGISVPALIARIAGLTEASTRGLAVALYTFLLFVGASLGPWIAQRATLLSGSTFFALLAGLMGMAALFSMSARRQAATT